MQLHTTLGWFKAKPDLPSEPIWDHSKPK